MFSTHVPANTVYNLLMAEPQVVAQLKGMETTTKAVIRKLRHGRARWDEYLPLWQVVKLQARFNSSTFASHGIGHAIRTVQYMHTIWPSCTTAMLWAALLHDVGYSEYDICRNCQGRVERIQPYVCSKGCNTPTGIYPDFYRANKFLHAELGANMIGSILNQYPRLFSKKDATMIIHAIRAHNADSHSRQLYKPRIHGTLLTIGQHNIQRKYIPVHFFKDKCLALLRIADNLDITRSRLTQEKSSIAVLMFQKKVSINSNISHLATFGQYVLQYPPSGNPKILASIFKGTTAQEFKFTYSLWIIKQLHFIHVDWSIPVFDLSITIHTTKITQLAFENNLPVALYQFKRMYDAFKSVWVGLRQLSDIVRIYIQDKWHTLQELSQKS
tara:strand:- start:249 stop:1403 length:1155 start_codon:yes stop_codon:yes gene_type:complete